jgi:hypothetical protein
MHRPFIRVDSKLTPHAVVVRELCKWGSSGSRSTMLFGMLHRNPVEDATILLVSL